MERAYDYCKRSMNMSNDPEVYGSMAWEDGRELAAQSINVYREDEGANPPSWVTGPEAAIDDPNPAPAETEQEIEGLGLF